MKKFCCKILEFQYKADREYGLNFRVIKLSDEFIERGKIKGLPFRFLITGGYREMDEKTMKMFIEYCPHCGQKLIKTYNSNEYINELNHEY